MSAKRAPSDDAELTLKIAAILAQSTDVESLPELLRTLCEELSWDLGEAWLLVPDQGQLQLASTWHASPDVAVGWIWSRRTRLHTGPSDTSGI
jgi:hypothetical protein